MAEITEKRFPRIVFTDSQDNSEISGGSSDFSIVKVTITWSSLGGVDAFIPYIDKYESLAAITTIYDSEPSVTLNVPLYKGETTSMFHKEDSDLSISTTGDIQYVNYGICLITGDGTITISTGNP